MNLSHMTAILLLGAALTLLAGCSSGAADAGLIVVADARVPVPPGANAAAYMTLRNEGDGAVQLTEVTTDVADTVELHRTTTAGGSMSMRQLDGIEIPAGGETVLEPGGLHIMLVGVDSELAEGDTVDLTLTFDNADEQTVSAAVVPTGDVPAMETRPEPTDRDSGVGSLRLTGDVDFTRGGLWRRHGRFSRLAAPGRMSGRSSTCSPCTAIL